MRKIFLIVLCISCLGAAQLHAQGTAYTDSLRAATLAKQQDSIMQISEQRQQKRIARQDSIRKAKKAAREQLRKQNREFINRKKERERIRVSVAKASKKAAAARKAYRKSLKKSGQRKKEVVKKGAKQKRKKGNAKKSLAEREQKYKSANYKKKKEKEIKKEVAQAKERKEVLEKENGNNRKKIDTTFSNTVVSKEQKLAARQRDSSTNNNKVGTDNNGIYPPDQFRPSFFAKRKIIKERPDRKRSLLAFQFGPSAYIGDLGGGTRIDQNVWSDISFKENTYFYGFSFTHLRREAVGIRLSYVFGKIAGSDKNTYYSSFDDPSYSRFVRNLDFQSKINEGSLLLELYPFKFLSYRTNLHHSFLQPYALFGLGYYSFNPQGSLYDPILEDNVWYDLQPLFTEGQGFSEFPDRQVYKLQQWSIPYGIGFNYELSQSLSLGLEVVGRKLFTDYLDDVSTSYINPSLFDEYLPTESAELAKLLNNKSEFVDAQRAYKPGQQRGSPSSNDLFYSISGRLIIKINRNKNKTLTQTKMFKYDDSEICE